MRVAARAPAKPRPQSATRCRTICASANGRSRSRAQQVLRLLGEASTLRNQLAQIDEYLAAIERDTARARKEEEGASADLARLDRGRRPSCPRKLSARQMELESLADRRQPRRRRI